MSLSNACSGPDPRVVQPRPRSSATPASGLRRPAAGTTSRPCRRARRARGQRRAVPTGLHPVAAGLEADQPDPGVVQGNAWKHPDRVRPAADNRRPPRWAAGRPPGQYPAPAPPVRSRGGSRAPSSGTGAGPAAVTQQVVGRPEVRHPVAQRLVDRVLQRAGADRHRHPRGRAQQDRIRATFSACPPGVDLAPCRRRTPGPAARPAVRGGHAVLAGPRSRRSPGSCPIRLASSA